MTDRMLIKGGIVLTQDPTLGEMADADVLIEGGKIAAIGHELSADGARMIDAAGDIVIPGFIDTHRHTWETSIRTCAPDFTLGAYFAGILDRFAPNYRPDDVYAGNLWGALECINAGITTLVDWSHIMNTPAHADEAIRGLQELGIRSVFAFGFPNTSLQDWWFGPDYAGSVLSIDGDCARRLRSQYFNSDDGLITMALATRGTNFCRRGDRAPGMGARQGARPQHHGPCRDVPVRLHEDAAGEAPGDGPSLPEHDLHPLLAPDRGRVGHGPRLGRQRLVRAADRAADGPRLGTGSQGDRLRRADRPVVGRRDDRVIGPVHPDALDLRLGARSRRFEVAWDENLEWNEPETKLITARQVLAMATIGGAQVAGIADRTGSLTPGKQADIVIIDGSAVNVAPIIDPVGAVVCAADVSNVKTVMVGGKIVKEDFRLKATLDAPRKAVEGSRDYLISKFGDPEPGWVVKATA